jgi:hypothetical protein
MNYAYGESAWSRSLDGPLEVRHQVIGPDPDRVDDSHVWQFATFAEPVDRRRADPQPFGYISHVQQSATPAMKRGQVSRRRCCDLRRRSGREGDPDFG